MLKAAAQVTETLILITGTIITLLIIIAGGASGAAAGLHTLKTRLQTDTRNSRPRSHRAPKQREDKTAAERSALLQTVVHCK